MAIMARKGHDRSAEEHRAEDEAGSTGPLGPGRELPAWMLPEPERRTWYGRKRKPQVRKPTPKGGYDRFRGYGAVEDEVEDARPSQGLDMPAAIVVLGLVALLLAFLPLVKWLGLFFAFAAVVLATRELSKSDPIARIRLKGRDVRNQRMSRVGRFVALLAIVAVVATTLMDIKADRDARIKESGTGTDKVLSQDLNVRFGAFAVGRDPNGAETRVLPVIVTNKAGGTRSFEIQIEALDSGNRRVASEILRAPKMRSGEERELPAFQFVDSETTQTLKTATFRVAQAISED